MNVIDGHNFQKFILIEGSARNIGVLARAYIHVAFNIR